MAAVFLIVWNSEILICRNQVLCLIKLHYTRAVIKNPLNA